MNKGMDRLFARRTRWELSDNPVAAALARLKTEGVQVLDLTESNPTRAGIYYPPDMFLGALQDPLNLIYAPQPQGLDRTRTAVAAYQAARGVSVPLEQIMLTASTSEAYSFLFRLLMDPGDRVLLPAPSYPLFSYLADINDVKVGHYRLYSDGKAWRMDLDSLEEAAREGKAKAVILVSPNNPTGSFIKPDELARLNDLCGRHGMAIISDEVFSDYCFSESASAYRSLALNDVVLSFSLGGLSKALALPQMKLAWIMANGPQEVLKEALGRLEVIADTYLSVNTPVQNAAVTWLPQASVIQEQIKARTETNLAAVRSWAPKAGFSLCPVEGGWYAVVQRRLDLPEDEWAVRLLEEKHVYVHPGFYFDFEEEGYLVLSLLTSPETFRKGLQGIFS